MSLYPSPPSSRTTDLFTPPLVLLPSFSLFPILPFPYPLLSLHFLSPFVLLFPFPIFSIPSSPSSLLSPPLPPLPPSSYFPSLSFFLYLSFLHNFPLFVLVPAPRFVSVSSVPSLSLTVHAPYFPVPVCRISIVPILLLPPPLFSPCFPASSYFPSFLFPWSLPLPQSHAVLSSLPAICFIHIPEFLLIVPYVLVRIEFCSSLGLSAFFIFLLCLPPYCTTSLSYIPSFTPIMLAVLY